MIPIAHITRVTFLILGVPLTFLGMISILAAFNESGMSSAAEAIAAMGFMALACLCLTTALVSHLVIHAGRS